MHSYRGCQQCTTGHMELISNHHDAKGIAFLVSGPIGAIGTGWLGDHVFKKYGGSAHIKLFCIHNDRLDHRSSIGPTHADLSVGNFDVRLFKQ